VLKARHNGGKGSAVQRGILAARGKYILFADADNAIPIEEISKLLEKLEKEGFDLAVGSRIVAGAGEGRKPPKTLGGGLRWLVKNVFQIDVKDTLCGFKMYTAAAAHKLYSRQTIMGFSFDLEILYLAAKYGYKVAEVPVDWVANPVSKGNARKTAHRFLRDLLQIWMNNLKGVYR
jgi:dolichyl-phosphate beta-glucosyltransferase